MFFLCLKLQDFKLLIACTAYIYLCDYACVSQQRNIFTHDIK